MAIATVANAAELAREQLAGIEPRWSHVSAVGRRGEALCAAHGFPPELAIAAWLHDVGYAPGLVVTGLHPLDGAVFLEAAGAAPVVVSLVAHHTGSDVEAQERALWGELSRFPAPPADLLAVLTWLDLTTSPQGVVVTVADRLAEILRRYPAGDPVHRAITRASPGLVRVSDRAAQLLGR